VKLYTPNAAAPAASATAMRPANVSRDRFTLKARRFASFMDAPVV
jgi:hypothetical protein